MLDNKFHESLKCFVSSLIHSLDDVHLLHEVYQHLVFDFRIWSRCDFQVCLGMQVFGAFNQETTDQHLKQGYRVRALDVCPSE